MFNVGTTAEVSILELAREILAITGSDSEVRLTTYDEAYAEGFEDMYRRVPDISKVSELIGWTPTRTLEDIIGDVVTERAARLKFHV